VILGVAGLAAVAYGIIHLATEAAPSGDDIVARGVVAPLGGPGPVAVAFTAPAGGPYSVWLRTGDMESNSRDMVVASVACSVERPGLASTRFQGNRQGSALVIGDLATIGGFTAGSGENLVACRHEPFGRVRLRDRLRQEREFIVATGSPSDHAAGFWYLFGGLAALVPAAFLGVLWHRGRLRRTGAGQEW
jgi:hypothetical protein